MIGLLASSVAAVYVVRLLLDHFQARRSISDHPGYRIFFSQSSILSNFLPAIRGITPGSNHLFRNRHKMYEYFGWDIISAVSVWPWNSVTIYLADAAAIKEVTTSRARFPKSVRFYQTLLFFGPNIIASEGDEWKKYRKISAPAFSDRNNKLVWDETAKIMTELFGTVWGDQTTISLDHCLDVTLPIALFVIGAAGFGRKSSWIDDDSIPAGHQMTFKDALHGAASSVFLNIIIPRGVMGFTERTRKVRLAFDELHKYMTDMIRDRQTSEKEERHDLFSSLLKANDEDSGGAKLTESELIGNIYMFLIAGHESTAHTLCFAFALLALYPDEQETLFQHIKSVLSDGRVPTYEDMDLLTHSVAVFYETLRMFPAVTGIPKDCAEDTTLTTTNAQGEKTTIPIPKGAGVIIDASGLHFNPRYWEDPEVFKPARFLGKWPHDAFMPFSAGARACLGRKFFETEGIAVLTMLVSRYTIEVKEEPQFAGETFEAKRDRVLAAWPGLTLSPVRVPLTFKLRGTKHT
ncbi:cytochrome P450 [Collybia nuda]|uniref:Cytochrome P450 n=1 Tax=Collybia nuda TaxID=64659 RepID=A0A9P5Y8M6_9AGAR|nr:cytochrome P450 [Collybia nuda]